MAERWQDRLQIQPGPPGQRWCLQGSAGALAALARAVGVRTAAGRLHAQAQVRAPGGLWLQLGPHEAWWMPTGDPVDAVAARVAAELHAWSGTAHLRPPEDPAVERDHTVAYTDLSDAFVGWELTGSGTDEFLSLGCALDLAMLGHERCARTRLAQAPVVLAPHLQGCTVWTERSHGSYLERWLSQALASRC